MIPSSFFAVQNILFCTHIGYSAISSEQKRPHLELILRPAISLYVPTYIFIVYDVQAVLLLVGKNKYVYYTVLIPT